MKNIITPFKVGLLVLVAIGAFVYMFGSVSSSLFKGDEGYSVSVYLDDATGLAVRTRVMLAGIAVGEVEDIALESGRARVTMRIHPDVVLHQGEGEPLVNGATLTKRQASLLGDYYLQLTPGVSGPELGDGDLIHTIMAPPGLDEIFERMDTVAANVEAITVDIKVVTESLAQVLGSEEGTLRLEETIDGVRELVEALNRIAGDNEQSIDSILSNVVDITEGVRDITVSGQHSIDTILSDVAAMTTELRYALGQNAGRMGEGVSTLVNTLASIQLALDNLNYSLENMQVITDRIADGEGTIGRLINDPAISDETERLLTAANDLLGGVSSLQTWVELRSEYGINERSFKNYLSLNLRPREDKFYLFEFVDDPRGSTETTRSVIYSSDPTEPSSRVEEQTITREAFKFTLVLGRRWSVTPNRELLIGGRFGLIESTGGFGFNLWALRETLEARVDIFDVGGNDFARVKMLSILRFSAFFPDTPFMDHIFVQAGVDDLFNSGTRDFFLGAGLVFNDSDLKTMFIAAPSVSP